MSSNPRNNVDYGVETIKWQTRVALGCLVAGQSLWAQTAYVRQQQQHRCSCSMRLVVLHKCNMPLLYWYTSRTDDDRDIMITIL